MAEQEKFEQSLEEVSRRAVEMKKTLVEPFRKDDGTFITEAKECSQILEGVVSNSMYSLSKNGSMIAATNARSLQGYEKTHGHLPSDDLLASVSKAIENGLAVSSGKVLKGGIFESEGMSTTDGILLRDRLISLVLPVHLQMITSQMCTFIPGEFNQSEFFRIKRVAGSNFGTLNKGDIIDFDYDGLYSVMDQKHEIGTGNGTVTAFQYTSKVGDVVYPFKSKRTRVWVNHKLVAQDNGQGALAGTYENADKASVVVSGSVNNPLGTATVNFSVAPKTGDVIHIGYDVDIEHDPSLIPRVDHQMDSRVLYPHEAAINGNATIQALHYLRRELGQDIENLTLQAMRNLLAADKDRKHLRDMLFHATSVVEWSRVLNEHLTMRENYETLNAALLEVDSVLMNGNGVSGLVGIVGGTQAVNVFRYLPAPYFEAAPGFRSIAQPHYVGRVFGQWDLYCNPQQDPWTCLCFAKGPDHGMTAYVAGDAVPAQTFRHPILGDLVSRGTLWELAYRDMQPFDGEKYLCKLLFVE